MREPTREYRRVMIEFGAGGASCLEWPSSDAPLLVFSHATGFNAETYQTLLSPLAKLFNVIAGDFRGHGLSTLHHDSGLAEHWSVFRDDLIALLERISSRPVLLAGHSMGASVSLMVAVVVPERVRGLVLVEPVLLDPEAPVAPNRLALRASQRRSVFPSFDAALESYRGRGVFASWPENVLRDYLSGGTIANPDGTIQLSCPPEWEAEIYREAPVDIGALARKLACPLTILHGTVSSTASPRQLATILDAKPETRVVCARGASHFLPIERPDRVRNEITRMSRG